MYFATKPSKRLTISAILEKFDDRPFGAVAFLARSLATTFYGDGIVAALRSAAVACRFAIDPLASKVRFARPGARKARVLLCGCHDVSHGLLGIALGDLLRDIPVDLGLDVAVTSGTGVDPLGELAGLFQSPEMRLRVVDAFLGQGRIRNKTISHLFLRIAVNCNAREICEWIGRREWLINGPNYFAPRIPTR
jgi:hypothetical protein